MACQSCEGCNSCNSCQGCHGCNSCNTCQTCDTTCNGPSNGCLSCEAFCESDQLVSSWEGSFSWGVSVSADSLFFSRDTWNKIIKYINKARLAGEEEDSGLSSLSLDTNEYMTADKFNQVSNALFNLGGNSSQYKEKTVYAVGSKEKPKGDIVYGSYFTQLADQANHLKYKSDQCDLCNIKCDECNECQNCNKCQTSNSRNGICRSGNTSSDCCESATV